MRSGILGSLGALALGGIGSAFAFSAHENSASGGIIDYSKPPPSRKEQFDKIRKGTKESPFDIIVVGGGATGSGVALDAATRGLK